MKLSSIWYTAEGKPRTANPTVLFLSILVIALLFVVIINVWGDIILPPIDIFTAQLFGLLVECVGLDSTVNLKTIAISNGSTTKSIIISYGCDGVLAYLILASAILPFPSSLRSRLAGLGLGMLFVIIINQIRLSGLVAVMFVNESVEDFRFYHTTVGQIFALVMIFIFWQWWAARTLKKPAPVPQEQPA